MKRNGNIRRLPAGERFGRLVVVMDTHSTKVQCVCDCGKATDPYRVSLRAGRSRSCGCAAIEKLMPGWNKTHGAAGTPEYRAWQSMVARCSNPSHPSYPDYGGRGIVVCERWASDFQAFFSDMGPRPSGGEIDREDNMASYEPGNCRWTTRKFNQQNTRASRRWYVDGLAFKSASDAAKAFGVAKATVAAWCNGYRAAGVSYPPRADCHSEPLYDNQ